MIAKQYMLNNITIIIITCRLVVHACDSYNNITR